jgi:hypothetical protein
VDPDPASKNNVDPPGYGSTTLPSSGGKKQIKKDLISTVSYAFREWNLKVTVLIDEDNNDSAKVCLKEACHFCLTNWKLDLDPY